MKTSEQNTGRLIAFSCAAFCIFAGLFIVGTFNDMAISDTLYSPDNVLCKVTAAIGPMPLFSVLILLSGALLQRAGAIQSGARLPALITAAVLTLGLCGFGAKVFTSSSCLDEVFPSVRGSVPAMVITALVLLPLAFLGFSMAKKNADINLVRRIIVLMATILTAYILLEVIKSTMRRPRYRIVIQGHEGVGFMNWYERFTGYSKELPETLGVVKSEFASFPSGHSMMSMTCFITLPALSWIFTSLKGRELMLAGCGFAYSAVVMFSRIVRGAHFLSDVSFSGAVFMIFSVIYMLILKKTVKEEK